MGQTKQSFTSFLLPGFILLVISFQVHATLVFDIQGFRATYPAGKIGGASPQGLPANYVAIPPAKEYYLDYQFMFESGWQCVQGGKLPGLVGGTHTSGCDPIDSKGWSARFMWQINCYGTLYYYHQNRNNNCGDDKRFSSPGTFEVNKWNRITERVVVNTPGQSDGLAEVWFNGRKAVTLSNVKWRGNVSETTALIDNVSLQTFYGGSTLDWAPSTTTHALFSVFHVTDSLPDLSKPFDTTFTAPTSIASRPVVAGVKVNGPGKTYTVSYVGNSSLPLNTQATAGRVGLYTPQGRLLRTIVFDKTGVRWDGLDNAGNRVRPGVVLVKVEAVTNR